MRVRFGRSALMAVAGAGAYIAALSASRRLFDWHRALLTHAYAALGRLSAATDAPVAEALALGLALACAGALVWALVACARRRSAAPLRRWLAGLVAFAIGLGGALALMWPAWLDSPRGAQGAYLRAYGLDELEELILALDAVLRDASEGVDLSGPVMRLSAPPAELAQRVAQAYRAAGYASHPPKLSRAPEWMARLRIAGIFVPLTGEAVISPNDFDSALPFTMLHELAHAQGALREDEANLLALSVALGSGDAELIWSGALTALRYALNTLRALSPERFQVLRQSLSAPVLRELDAQRAFESEPRDCDALLSAVGAGATRPALARAGEAFVRVSGYGAYDGLTYLLLDAGWLRR